MGFEVLQSVICKYNYPLHKNLELKAITSSIFYQFFIFSPNDNPSKTMKKFFYVI